MTDFLVFNLYGPMASWGDIAVGEQRPSAAHPSKAAILGLLAAALGIRRDDEDKLRALNNSYGFSVRVNTPGELLRDYHTSQVPPEKRKARYYTRRAEVNSDNLYTILSTRDYRMESAYTIALWANTSNSVYSFDELIEAIKHPKYSLYLGRKSCPLSLPLKPIKITAQTLKTAFDQVPWQNDFLSKLPSGKQLSYYWEILNGEQAGMPASMVYPRRDQLLNRARWQFSERDEYYYAESQREAKS